MTSHHTSSVHQLCRWRGPDRPGRAALVLCTALLLAGCRTAVIDPIAIQDAQTAAQVKTALVNDPDLGTRTIEVTVVQGVVRLSGAVRSQAEADRAAALARSIQGVRDLRLELRIAVDQRPPSEAPALGQTQPANEPGELQGESRLLAVGVSLSRSNPRSGTLAPRLSVGPLFRLGSGRGLGPALALNWFQTTLAGPSGPDAGSRIHVRPLMGGLSYTWATERVSISPSLVGGVAFNSLTAPQAGEVGRIAIEVSNSLVWRPGVSVWVDVNRRAALNMTMGYVVTGLRVSFLEDGRLVKHDVPGDTLLLNAGVAYKLF